MRLRLFFDDAKKNALPEITKLLSEGLPVKDVALRLGIPEPVVVAVRESNNLVAKSCL